MSRLCDYPPFCDSPGLSNPFGIKTCTVGELTRRLEVAIRLRRHREHGVNDYNVEAGICGTVEEMPGVPEYRPNRNALRSYVMRSETLADKGKQGPIRLHAEDLITGSDSSSRDERVTSQTEGRVKYAVTRD